jgi:hypothetical protein
MKKQLISLSVLLVGAFGAHAQTSGTAKTATTKTQAVKAAVSENMKGFMAMFNGDSKAVTDALLKYEKEGLDRHDMDMYNLMEPKVVSTEVKDKTEKYLMEVKSGVTTRKFEIYWESGKISEIKDLGLKM